MYIILSKLEPLLIFLQLADTLSLVLPRSPIYDTLASLPLPDATNPNLTTTFEAQNAVHNSLPILEEIVRLLESHEEETLKKEVEKRRTRLGAAGPEQLKKEIGIDIWSGSQVRYPMYLQKVVSTFSP